jgi:hypothetical protein
MLIAAVFDADLSIGAILLLVLAMVLNGMINYQMGYMEKRVCDYCNGAGHLRHPDSGNLIDCEECKGNNGTGIDMARFHDATINLVRSITARRLAEQRKKHWLYNRFYPP